MKIRFTVIFIMLYVLMSISPGSFAKEISINKVLNNKTSTEETTARSQPAKEPSIFDKNGQRPSITQSITWVKIDKDSKDLSTEITSQVSLNELNDNKYNFFLVKLRPQVVAQFLEHNGKKPKKINNVPAIDSVIQAVEFNPVENTGLEPTDKELVEILAISKSEHKTVEKERNFFVRFGVEFIRTLSGVPKPTIFSQSPALQNIINAAVDTATKQSVGNVDSKRLKTISCGAILPSHKSAVWLLPSTSLVEVLIKVPSSISRVEVDYELCASFGSKLPDGSQERILSTKLPEPKYHVPSMQFKTADIVKTDLTKIEFFLPEDKK